MAFSLARGVKWALCSLPEPNTSIVSATSNKVVLMCKVGKGWAMYLSSLLFLRSGLFFLLRTLF
jgi:hypothetical protein